MKNLSVILFAILFLAITVLYVLHFTGGKTSDESTASTIEQMSGVTSHGIAFVNIDTIIFKFDMYFERRDALMAKQKSAETQLTSKGTQYEKNARDYQEKVTKGLVTRATAAEMEKALLQQQQDLVTLRDNLQNDLMEEEQVMNRQIIDYITRHLDENRAEYDVQFVLGKSFGSPVLYGDPGLDITKRVTDALNKKYQAEKKK
jgi:outer membrane protein